MFHSPTFNSSPNISHKSLTLRFPNYLLFTSGLFLRFKRQEKQLNSGDVSVLLLNEQHTLINDVNL